MTELPKDKIIQVRIKESNQEVRTVFNYNDFNDVEKKFQIIVDELGFKLTNISSIIGRGKKPISLEKKKRITAVLVDSKIAILSLKSKVGFTSSNISSILCGSGTKTVEAVKDFVDNAHALTSLKKYGFELQNISSILGGAGAKTAEAIKALVDNAHALASLKEYGFKVENISSILHGAGAKTAEAIKIIDFELSK